MTKYYQYLLFTCPNGQVFFKSSEMLYTAAMNVAVKEKIFPYSHCGLIGYQCVSVLPETEIKALFKAFLENKLIEEERSYKETITAITAQVNALL